MLVCIHSPANVSLPHAAAAAEEHFTAGAEGFQDGAGFLLSFTSRLAADLPTASSALIKAPVQVACIGLVPAVLT